MTGIDAFGLSVSLAGPVAVQRWNAMQLAFLAHGADTPRHLAAVLRAEPEFAAGHAVKGLFLVLLGRRELLGEANEALAIARASMEENNCTRREWLYIDALASCLADRPSRAVQAMERILDRHPEDALAAKLSHAFRFVLGDALGMRSSIERVLPAYTAAHPAYGYILGCLAFSLEETGEYRAAEAAGHEAVGYAPNDAWGLHAVAHVHDMTGNARSGLEWLTGREAAWSHCNNFRYHVWWHKALMCLDLGRVDEVLALYDTEVRRDHTDDYRDIANATSLLVRLELEGVPVGDRWEELADICAKRTEDGCLVFADLHYLLALIGDNRGRDIQRLVTRIARDGTTAEGDNGFRMARPGLSAARGLQAFGAGDFDTAFINLAAAREAMQIVGGSHAQRDVFERLAIDCGLRAGRLDHVGAILADRTRRRGGRLDGYGHSRKEMIESARANLAARSVQA